MTELVAALRAQRAFVLLTVLVAVLRFVPGRVPGAAETWATILALWLAGVVTAAWRDRRPRAQGTDLPAALGAQNLAIQMTIVVPGILVGTARMVVDADAALPPAFSSNALGTLIVLPLASLVILTLAALPPALGVRWIFRRLAFVVLLGALAPGIAAAAPRCREAPRRPHQVSVATPDANVPLRGRLHPLHRTHEAWLELLASRE